MYNRDDPFYNDPLEDLMESLKAKCIAYEKHDLLFLEPVFHPGLNVTVRNGDKWMKADVGDDLLIKKTGEDKIIHTGMLLGKAYVPFKLIPDEWLAHEHDPKCLTREGLFEHGMKPAYPDFTEDDFVTVLLLVIDSSEFS